MEEFFNIGLPKWPALLVKGKRVTEDQAKEIIIRTDNFYFSGNDPEFTKELNDIVYGFKADTYEMSDVVRRRSNMDWNEYNQWKETMEAPYLLIDLVYLNNQRIISSWVGGPHGWCDWEGNIGCNNYNIGKWPSVSEVYSDWEKIAGNFPYLDLTCQLLDGETCEDDPKPLIEFRILNGKVEMSIPKEQIVDTDEVDIISVFRNQFGERGCTLERFEDAINHTKNVMSSVKFEPIKN